VTLPSNTLLEIKLQISLYARSGELYVTPPSPTMALTVYAIKVETFELPVKKNSSNGEKNAIFPFFDRDKKSMFFKRAETSAKKYKL